MSTTPATRPRLRSLAGALIGVLAGVVLALLPLTPAQAHASLLSSDPEEGAVLPTAPASARLTFDESISLPGNGVHVFDATGKELSSSATTRDAVLTVDLPDSMADGTYVVSWRVVSADGHPVAGSLTFSVGAPSPVVRPPAPPTSDASVRALLSAADALRYLGLFVASGLAIFCCWMLPGIARLEQPRDRLRRVARGAAAVAIVAGLLQLPLSGAYQQGSGAAGALLDGWSGVTGDAGTTTVLMVIGLLTAVLPLGTAAPSRYVREVTTTGVAIAVLSPALVGHTRAFEPQWPLVLTDVLHLAAGTIWLGGLVGLAISLPALAGRARAAAETLAAFSTTAATVLALLLASGSLLGWRILNSWSALVDTGYGRLLLVKVALVALAASIAGWNRFRLLPRLAATSGHEPRRAATHLVRRTVIAEAGLLVVVLMLTGFLVNLSPRPEATRPADNPTHAATATLGGDLRVVGALSPGRRGANTLTVQLQDRSGEPYEPTRPPTVRVGDGRVDLGEVALTPSDTGTFTARVVLPRDGTWTVQVGLRLSEFENPVAGLSFVVPAPR